MIIDIFLFPIFSLNTPIYPQFSQLISIPISQYPSIPTYQNPHLTNSHKFPTSLLLFPNPPQKKKENNNNKSNSYNKKKIEEILS
jgi:hypothetical protein